ncbi:MAG: hypothetical protein ACOYNZ_04075 [Rhodoferax sp.]
MDYHSNRMTKTKLRNLARAMKQRPAAFIITVRLGNMEYVNPRFEKMPGVARVHLVKRVDV